MANSHVRGARMPGPSLAGWPGADSGVLRTHGATGRAAVLTPVTLAVLAAGLMLVLAVATVAAVGLGAPLVVSIPLAATALAIRPGAVLLHRHRSSRA